MTPHLHEHEAALYAIYLTLAGQYHPDVSEQPREVAKARLRKVKDAYEVLRDALRNVAPEAASPSGRDHPFLRQGQATLSARHKKRRLEPFVFVLILVTLAAALCYLILDIQHWMAMAP
jgi:DnaJ domain